MLICIYAHYQGTILELLPPIKMHDILINVHPQETSLTGTKIYQILYISTLCMKYYWLCLKHIKFYKFHLFHRC